MWKKFIKLYDYIAKNIKIYIFALNYLTKYN